MKSAAESPRFIPPSSKQPTQIPWGRCRVQSYISPSFELRPFIACFCGAPRRSAKLGGGRPNSGNFYAYGSKNSPPRRYNGIKSRYLRGQLMRGSRGIYAKARKSALFVSFR